MGLGSVLGDRFWPCWVEVAGRSLAPKNSEDSRITCSALRRPSSKLQAWPLQDLGKKKKKKKTNPKYDPLKVSTGMCDMSEGPNCLDEALGTQGRFVRWRV